MLFQKCGAVLGVSISYALGSTEPVTIDLLGMVILSLLATLVLRDRSGIPLGPEHEAAQRVNPIRGTSTAVPVLD